MAATGTVALLPCQFAMVALPVANLYRSSGLKIVMVSLLHWATMPLHFRICTPQQLNLCRYSVAEIVKASWYQLALAPVPMPFIAPFIVYVSRSPANGTDTGADTVLPCTLGAGSNGWRGWKSGDSAVRQCRYQSPLLVPAMPLIILRTDVVFVAAVTVTVGIPLSPFRTYICASIWVNVFCCILCFTLPVLSI